jgi:hypothetical protein
MANKNDPEALKNSPEFIKVIYDEDGRPIGVKSAENPGEITNEKSNFERHARPMTQSGVATQTMNPDAIVKWIINLNQHVRALREELNLVAMFNQKKFNDLQKAIAEKEKPKNTEVMEKITILENAISSVANELTKKMAEMAIPQKEMASQLSNHMNAIGNQMNAIEVCLSSITKEVASTKLNELENGERIMALAQETQGCKLSNIDIAERLSCIEEDIKKMKDGITSSNIYNESVALSVEQKLAEISSTVSNLTADISQRFSDVSYNQRELGSGLAENAGLAKDAVQRIDGLFSKQEELAAAIKENSDLNKDFRDEINSLSKNQEKLVLELYDKMNRKYMKLISKMKKGQKKISRARISRLLKKKIMLETYDKILVVSDKMNSNFASVIFDVVRKSNKKTVMVVMDNRKKIGQEPEQAVREAMEKVDVILVSAKYYLENTKSLKRCRRQGKPVFAVKKSLRVTKM